MGSSWGHDRIIQVYKGRINKKGYYSFAGSLTTPPCSEGVQWMVLKEPVKLGPQQIKAFRQLYNANARPLQPLNGRVVKEST